MSVFDPVWTCVYVLATSDTVRRSRTQASGKHRRGHNRRITAPTHGIASVHTLGKGYTDDKQSPASRCPFDLKDALRSSIAIRLPIPDADGIV